MIDDEFHYLFICQCKEIVEIQNKFIPNYYINNPNENKMIGFFHLCQTEYLLMYHCLLENLVYYFEYVYSLSPMSFM